MGAEDTVVIDLKLENVSNDASVVAKEPRSRKRRLSASSCPSEFCAAADKDSVLVVSRQRRSGGQADVVIDFDFKKFRRSDLRLGAAASADAWEEAATICSLRLDRNASGRRSNSADSASLRDSSTPATVESVGKAWSVDSLSDASTDSSPTLTAEHLFASSAVPSRQRRKRSKAKKVVKKSAKKTIRKRQQQQQDAESEGEIFKLNMEDYKLSNHLALYRNAFKNAYPQLLCDRNKYFVESDQGGILSHLFGEFCNYMKMEKIKNLPTEGGERVFCWLGKRRAMELLPSIRQDHHFVNRLPLDICLKDKQSMVNTLAKHMLRHDCTFEEHACPQTGAKMKKQKLCEHQYAKHTVEPCQEPGCMTSQCICFRSNFFVPESHVFASTLQQSIFIDKLRRLANESQWIAKPSYMKGGRGVRILPSVESLREFLKIESVDRCMWGQNYLVQRYIPNPMLTTEGHKFDLRMILLIVVCRFNRVLGFFHPGFVRKVPQSYERPNSDTKVQPNRYLASTRAWLRCTEPKVTTPDGEDDDSDAKWEPPEGQFFNDQCEDYNKSVRSGCLSKNSDRLPALGGRAKLPSMKEIRQAYLLQQQQQTQQKQQQQDEEGSEAENSLVSVNLDNEADKPLTTKSKEFMLALHRMVKAICESIFDQIKEKSNCYQMFSLDICVDDNGKPWLLEINPSIISESFNKNSATVVKMVPSIFAEGLSIVIECAKKSFNFMAIRMASNDANRPNDLLFRQNFLWWYSTPFSRCRLFEMKMHKLSMERAEEIQLNNKGLSWKPVDYYPWINKKIRDKRETRRLRSQVKSNCLHRFPTPVAKVPVLKVDVDYSFRFRRVPMGAIRRQEVVRRMQRRATAKQKEDRRKRLNRFLLAEQKKRITKKMRVKFD